MKVKYLLIVGVALVFAGCVDNSGNLGLNMLPDSDGIKVSTHNFSVQTTSQVSDSVYAKTSTGYVGKFTDTEHGFGYYEGSFLTELNCIDNLSFPKVYDPVSNRSKLNMVFSLDSAYLYARLHVLYTNFFGDSLNPMQLGVYRLEKKLSKNNLYTNINPEYYLGSSPKLLAKRTFAATDLSDSTRFQSGYYKSVSFLLDNDFGKELISTNWSNPGAFANSDTFIENVLKGVYIKTEAGDGTVLYADQIVLDVAFRSYALDSVGGILKTYDESTDSIIADGRVFASTKEVIQSNRINLSAQVEEKAKEKEWTYLKSPAGIFTKAVLPIGDIVRGLNLETDTINSVKLVFNAYPHETMNEFSMSPPNNVLLIKSADVKDFFEKNLLPDNKSSYLATYANNKYTFGNITRLATSLIDEMKNAKEAAEAKGDVWNENKWLEGNSISIIPVYVNLYTDPNTKKVTIINVQHDLKPTFVKLQGGKNGSLIDLQVVYSRFND